MDRCVLLFLLALLIAVPCAGMSEVQAATTLAKGSCGDDVSWKLTSDGKLTVSGSGVMKDYASEEDTPWDTYRKKIKTIVISDGVTQIGDYAFSGLEYVKSVTIADTVTDIGDDAFYGDYKITKLSIPENVSSIGSSAFFGCEGLTAVTIPGSVKKIGAEAFSYCTGLTDVVICDGVEEIGDGAFSVCGLTQISIPGSVETIGVGAFLESVQLATVSLNDGLKKIGENAFAACWSLETITIPSTVTSVDSSAFDQCYCLRSIKVSSGSRKYTSENGILYNRDMTKLIRYPIAKSAASYTMPDTVTSMSKGAFYDCSGLKKITLSEALEKISSYAFYGCSSLQAIDIPDSVTKIGAYAFDGCEAMSSVSIGAGVTFIGKYAFWGTGLKKVTIPDNVETIGAGAFAACSSLKKVTIGTGVTSIGNEAFSASGADGSVLASVVFRGSAPSIGSKAFDSVSAVVKYPLSESSSWTTGKQKNYGGDLTWKSYHLSLKTSSVSVSLSKTIYTFDADKTRTPSVTVQTNGRTLKKGTDYTLTWSSDERTSIGRYTVTITGKGDYTGSVTKAFRIRPAQVTLRGSVKSSASGKLTVKWSKVSGSVTKYQIRYRVKGTDTWKTKTVSASKTSGTICGLKSGKKYQVQVRACKTVDGTKIYGKWSSAQTVTVK